MHQNVGFFKIKLSTIFIWVAATISLTKFAEMYFYNKQLDKERAKKRAERATNADLYDYERVEAALDFNRFLSDDEKNLIRNMKFVFDENHQYMNYDLIVDRIRTLKINYTTEQNGDVAGNYSKDTNTITIFKSTGFYDCLLSTIIHEILHVFQSYEYKTTFVMELSNEVCAREITRRLNEMHLVQNPQQFQNSDGYEVVYGKGYDSFIPIYYWLADTIDKETFRDFQFYPDTDILVEALAAIDGNKSGRNNGMIDSKIRAQKLLACIDSLRTYNYKSDCYSYDTSIETYSSIFDQIAYFYFEANGKSIESDLGEMLKSPDVLRYINAQIGSKPTNPDLAEIDQKTYSNGKNVCDTIMALAEPVLPDVLPNNMEVYLTYEGYYLPRTYLSNKHLTDILVLPCYFSDVKLLYYNYIVLDDAANEVYWRNRDNEKNIDSYEEEIG